MQGLFLRAALREGARFAIVYGEHGREAYHVADERGGFSDAAALLQEQQRFGGEHESCGMQACVRRLNAAVEAGARFGGFRGGDSWPAHLHASGHAVDGSETEVGEVIFDLFGRVDEAFERARQFAADEYSEHFVARFCDAFDNFANLAQRRLARGGNVVSHFVDIFIEGIEVGFQFDELFVIPIDDERGNFDAELGANVLGNGRG